MRITNGITFLIHRSRMFAIHAHTPTAPCAQSTFEYLSEDVQSAAVWVYLPIPRGERILAFGERTINGGPDGIMVILPLHPPVGSPVPTPPNT